MVIFMPVRLIIVVTRINLIGNEIQWGSVVMVRALCVHECLFYLPCMSAFLGIHHIEETSSVSCPKCKTRAEWG